MTMLARRTPTLAYASLAVVDAALAARGHHQARRVTKPLLMPALNLAMRSRTGSRHDSLLHRTAMAQLFSWGGDVALLASGEKAFLSGAGSFAVAHACYIAAFSSVRDPQAGPTDRGPAAGAAVWVALAPVMANAAGRKAPSLRLPVAAYAGILAAMFASSTQLDRRLPSGARRRIMAGTGLFLVSDGLIGLQDFLLGQDSPPLEAAIMATYTAGQWLIADGVARTA